MTPDQIRERYLRFFEEQDHRVVASSPVVPLQDPTLLFTNAGMNQFKDLLLGNEVRDYTRAASVQKCIRAGGKHNDLDEVGRDGRHLTFFEMLGNWSFGDYYKKDSIHWAWKFVTQILDLDPDRLYVSTYKDDDEAYDIWHDEIGIPDSHLARQGDVEAGNEENFWSMGDTGPCGPCTELFYDLKPELGPVTFEEGAFDEDRVVEFWNIVFMEFNRDSDGVFHELAMKSVDTGMGLDRMAMIKAGQDNVFKSSLFSPILLATASMLGHEVSDVAEIYGQNDFSDYCVIADHIRSVTFSLCDGAKFANTGRGSVLRSILRRAMRHGQKLGFEGPFLHELAHVVVEHYGKTYPELSGDAARLIKVEEERFLRTLSKGLTRFESHLKERGDAGFTDLEPGVVADLHTTYGFPWDMTRIMAQDAGFTVDEDAVRGHMESHILASKGAKTVDVVGVGDWTTVTEGSADGFTYAETSLTTHLRKVRSLGEGNFQVTLANTPFYAESGGQGGDTGTIRAADGSFTLEVTDTQKAPIGRVHTCTLTEGTLEPGTSTVDVVAEIDTARRARISYNHTATHLLHAALHAYVSEEATQAGSMVAPEKLRFDFAHDTALTPEQLADVESWVNAQIRAAHDVVIHEDVPSDVATGEMGAMALFGEKYGDLVRVVDIPGASSVELCGGTHVRNTAEINLFRITSESSVSAGTRRVEAVTHSDAHALFQADRDLIAELASALRVDAAAVLDRARVVINERADLDRQVQKLTQRLAHLEVDELVAAAAEINGVKVLAQKISVDTRDAMLAYADQLKTKLDQGIILLAAELDGKAALLCLVTDATFKAHKIKAGDLINAAATHIGGRGGGRPTLAQAGGSNPAGLQDAVDAFEQIARDALG